jgi:hypothetical protein
MKKASVMNVTSLFLEVTQHTCQKTTTPYRIFLSSALKHVHYAQRRDYMRYQLKIEQDTDPMNPREEYDNMGTMIAYHSNYILGDNPWKARHSQGERDYIERDELVRIVQKPDVISLPLYLYNHSGITMRTTPFSCSWDSGQVGYIFCYRDKVTAPDQLGEGWSDDAIKQVLNDEVETYDQYLTGDVWGYVITDTETDEVVDSCWGFYGHDSCEEEGEATRKYFEDRVPKQLSLFN